MTSASSLPTARSAPGRETARLGTTRRPDCLFAPGKRTLAKGCSWLGPPIHGCSQSGPSKQRGKPLGSDGQRDERASLRRAATTSSPCAREAQDLGNPVLPAPLGV